MTIQNLSQKFRLHMSQLYLYPAVSVELQLELHRIFFYINMGCQGHGALSVQVLLLFWPSFQDGLSMKLIISYILVLSAAFADPKYIVSCLTGFAYGLLFGCSPVIGTISLLSSDFSIASELFGIE